MAENYIKPEDVSPQDAQKVLDFLNSAQSAAEIAEAVEIPSERDVGIRVSQHILDRREQLGGFTNLQQVADVPQVGPERFTEIVTTLSGKQQGGNDMAQIIEIRKYLYYLFSSREDATPVLFLYDANNNHVAYVYFRGGSEPLPEASQYASGKYALYYRRSVLPELIDMLRNEKPIYLIWVDGINTRISTAAELIGEEETP